jgi:hypothetical protein
MGQGAPFRVLTADEKDLVRRELARLVESPAFRQSKRCCRLLTHTITAALNESWDSLRERNLGVELFNRAPDYGTTEDAVVRVAAAETRKRLAQYYDQAGQIEGLRIELPAGGYVPEFRFAEPVPPPATAGSRSYRMPAWIAAATLAAVVIAYLVWANLPSPADRFWQPLNQSKDPVLIALGIVHGLNGGGDIDQFRFRATEACKTPAGCEKFFSGVHPIARGNIPTGDAIGLGHMMGHIGKMGKQFRIRGVLDITYSNLKEEDAVLVGYFSNPWTVELHQHTRFALVHDALGYRVLDRQNPNTTNWTMTGGWPRMRNQEDYALITRVTDPQTRRTHYTAAGFTPFGTEAAAALLGDSGKLSEFLSALPAGWPAKNLQLVIHTRVKSMIPGPPKLVAAHVW